MAALPEGLARAEGMTGIIIFAVVYAIVAILGKMKQASQQGAAGGSRPEPRRPAQQPRRQPPRPAPPERAPNTQGEATRLEELLRALGEAAGVPTTEGPMGRPARMPLPSAEEVEERESLEVEEQVLNLETEVKRPARRDFDHDDEAEAIVERRIRAAESRDKALSRADHKAFDASIRKVTPDNTRVARKRPSLREAMVWREILGPPVGLRDREDPGF